MCFFTILLLNIVLITIHFIRILKLIFNKKMWNNTLTCKLLICRIKIPYILKLNHTIQKEHISLNTNKYSIVVVFFVQNKDMPIITFTYKSLIPIFSRYLFFTYMYNTNIVNSLSADTIQMLLCADINVHANVIPK